jgi:hypothetical protein
VSFNLPLLIRRRRLLGGSGPTPFEVLDAFTTGKTGTGVYDGRTATVVGSTLTVSNLSGNALPFLQATTARQPSVSASTGLGFDAVDDSVSVDMLGTGAVHTVMARVRKSAGSTSGFVIGAAARYQSGSGLTLSGISVDGVSVGTRDALYVALNDGAWHTVTYVGIPFGDGIAARAYALGHPLAGVSFSGSAVGTVILLNSAFPTDLAAATAAANAWLVSISP